MSDIDLIIEALLALKAYIDSIDPVLVANAANALLALSA